jgi:hypothetical protein
MRLSCVLVLALLAGAGPACNSTDMVPADPTAPLLGAWNYDQPNVQSGVNMAQIDCPLANGSPAFSTIIPQIGNVVFSKRADRIVQGKTDQGCTWTFAVEGSTAELSPAAQTCFNDVIGSSYTITKWSITLSGFHETEDIAATSHLAVDCAFGLPQGNRTKADAPGSPDPTTPFLGTWTFGSAGPSGANVANTMCTALDGGASRMQEPQVGTLTVAKQGADTIAATTADGCTSTLSVVGNTAELAQGATCSQALSPSFWSMATDGQTLVEIVGGTEQGCGFLLTNGWLTHP